MQAPSYQHIDCCLQQGVLVLTITRTRLEGQEVAEALRQEMVAAAEHFQAKLIVVDYHLTQYISSAAFWPLLSLGKKVKDASGRVLVCGLNPQVGDVFYTTKLVSPDGSFAALFQMEADVASAVSRLQHRLGEEK
jgi:anti-anti-sigma factor